MSEKELKIGTLNLGGKRVLDYISELCNLLKDQNLDILCLQEALVFGNGKKTHEIINSELQFPFVSFHESHNYAKDYGKGKISDKNVTEGLAIFSKSHFTSEKFDLPVTRGLDRWPRICILAHFDTFSLCNLHLSKHKESRDKEFGELPKSDIYAGDFNSQPGEMEEKGFSKNSYSFRKYVSYPSKNITLDYVSSDKIRIKSVEELETKSDHKLVVTRLSFLRQSIPISFHMFNSTLK